MALGGGTSGMKESRGLCTGGGLGTDKANRNDGYGSKREAICYGYWYAKVKAMKYTRWAMGCHSLCWVLNFLQSLGSGGQLLPIRVFSVKGCRRGCVCLSVEQNQDRAEGIIRSCWLFGAKENAHGRTAASGSCSGMRGNREVTGERREERCSAAKCRVGAVTV